MLLVSGLLGHNPRARASSDSASESTGPTTGSGNGRPGSIGNPGMSCLAPRLLEVFFVVTGVGRRFEIVNSGEALPELPITRRIVSRRSRM